MGDEEARAVRDLLHSKRLFRYQGPDSPSRSFLCEKAFSDYLGNPHSLLLTSGTNALLMALKALGIGAGDEVLIPSYTFVATVNAVLLAGAIPVVVPVTEELILTPESLKSQLTPKTKALIVVHMDGLPNPMTELSAFAREKGLVLIEDVAQAMGGTVAGKFLGTWGQAGCFSFNADKIITAGEGGLLTLAEELTYKKALALHDGPVSFGATFKDYLGDLPPVVGHSMRVSEITAVILEEQLKKLPGILQRLRERKAILATELKGLPLILGQDRGDCSTHIHLVASDPLAAKTLGVALTKAGLLARPLYTHPAHCFWQWQHLLPHSSAHLGDHRLYLSSVLKLSVPYAATLDETQEWGRKIAKIWPH